ncbi:hypothetical protein L596_010227 [Steinernema carpocapsae]|uniref:Uncharacterized protein n=1 Tax=Steinernema carpocapsae TaxID=34508 RepID=A0A4U5PHX8_STECR|nr:hypothetical protein L596_010227 [Steinernema carpocapsae]
MSSRLHCSVLLFSGQRRVPLPLFVARTRRNKQTELRSQPAGKPFCLFVRSLPPALDTFATQEKKRKNEKRHLPAANAFPPPPLRSGAPDPQKFPGGTFALVTYSRLTFAINLSGTGNERSRAESCLKIK